MYKGYLRAPLKRQFNLMWITEQKAYLLLSEHYMCVKIFDLKKMQI